MLFNKMDKVMRVSDADVAFKKLAKEYREQGKDLEKVKDYSLVLQKKNRELMVENGKLKRYLSTLTED